MSENKPKRNLVGPWRSLHGAFWLFGLGYLALTGRWWPGILFLVALSLILEAILQRFAPQAYEEELPAAPEPAPEPVQTPAPPAPPPQEHRFDLLPAVCPKCGGPTRGTEVRWTGPQSADCPYCGANLPMRQG